MAVLSPDLREDMGAGPGDLAVSSGMWFFAFAGCRCWSGSWLDRYGPRRTASGLMLVAALGAAVFALAQAPWHLHLAMALIGIGCSPALMSAYYIFARNFTLREFGTLAGSFVAVGALGNILSRLPLVAVPRRLAGAHAMWSMVAVTLGVAAVEWLVVRDPERLDASHRRAGCPTFCACGRCGSSCRCSR
jgi:MFS family permease